MTLPKQFLLMRDNFLLSIIFCLALHGLIHGQTANPAHGLEQLADRMDRNVKGPSLYKITTAS